ncbi:MAG: AAA family ATPase [bacterium]|nr:AAA family ATPase [bacterium]
MTEPDYSFENPFRPGAGHMPPYLAGRTDEQDDFRKALRQTTILENVILTGPRGVGKTVLLETFKPIARQAGWLWVGQDLSEAASLTEHNLSERMMADLAVVTSGMVVRSETQLQMGFGREDVEAKHPLGYQALRSIYDATPGLASDKLKAVLMFVWRSLAPGSTRGIVFAYDEAQNLADHAKKGQFPLSLMLDVFQSIQRMDVPYLLVLTGLPTLFPKLVDARTYTERMFHVLFLNQLNERDSRDAITKPIEGEGCPITFKTSTVDLILETSGGYPYFIQFICREYFDTWLNQNNKGERMAVVNSDILRKLDTDFFVGRWSRATDRQRELMEVIASLPNCDSEFTVQEVADMSKSVLDKPFSRSHVSQMLVSLSHAGLVYKNRYGKYLFAVPLLSGFIKRHMQESWSALPA